MSYQKTEFDKVYQCRVGGFNIVLGTLTHPATSDPVIYAAAMTERELRKEDCGYGTTEAEAVADLFRLMRPTGAFDLPLKLS
jgi:hypothetical protein